MRIRLTQSFTNAIIFEIMIVIILTVGVLGYLWINNEYEAFNQAAESQRLEYINNQQNMIRNEVNRQIEYIQYMKAETEKILMEDIKSRTYEAYNIAINIYNQNRNKMSDAQIKKLITDSIRNVRFNQGRGYYFIDSLEGDVILYPILPESEGSNLINLTDGNGNYTLKEEIRLVKEQNEGYITGYWLKPNYKDKKANKKITFVKKFEPYNWYLGTGEYVDDVVMDIQKEILEQISAIRFGYRNDNYIFVGNFDGVELANGVYKEYVGQNLWNMTDAKGAKVIQEQIKTVKKYPEGGFVTHFWETPETREVFEKMTFVKGVPEWNWVVGSGVQLDEIERVISSNRALMERDVTNKIKNIIFILLAVLLLAFTLTKYLTDKSRKSFEIFLTFLRNASKEFVEIDKEKVHYSEFKALALAANEMIVERNLIEEKIRKMNDELEDRILERTKEIEELNENLEKKVKERTLELKRMLIIDGLTQIYNHKYMYERLEEEVRKAIEHNEKFCVIMFDIDHFKDINDRFGHQCGDKVLTIIASTIKENIRAKDFAGRYGGEEFIVILPKTNIETGYLIAERVKNKIRDLRFDESNLVITISGGIIEYSSESAVEMVKKADEKLYEAKKNGRNRIQR